MENPTTVNANQASTIKFATTEYVSSSSIACGCSSDESRVAIVRSAIASTAHQNRRTSFIRPPISSRPTFDTQHPRQFSPPVGIVLPAISLKSESSAPVRLQKIGLDVNDVSRRMLHKIFFELVRRARHDPLAGIDTGQHSAETMARGAKPFRCSDSPVFAEPQDKFLPPGPRRKSCR